MPRFRIAPALSLIAVVAVAACSANSVSAPASSTPPAGPSASPSAAPVVATPPSATPLPATPAPTEPPVATPRPTAAGFTDAEQHLLDGVQRGTVNCQPAGRDSELPKNAVAGIECDSTDPAVARIGFYAFANDEDMLATYLARMHAEGVEVESGTCNEGESEHAYIPDEGFAQDRAGCFLNADGFANYRYTVSGNHVYVGLLGKSNNLDALENFAWKGNQDMPGRPTLWFGGID
jgi:hypothetical protein